MLEFLLLKVFDDSQVRMKYGKSSLAEALLGCNPLTLLVSCLSGLREVLTRIAEFSLARSSLSAAMGGQIL